MKTNLFRLIPKLFVVWLLIAVQACDNDPAPIVPVGADGFFVVNEGAFNGSNTSISFYDRETGVMSNDVFAANNAGRALGDQAQSATVFEGKAYVVVQHSAKVEVINADDYKSIKTITEGIESPRYFIGISSSKGYLSDWGDGFTGSVKVIDLNDFKVTKTIATGMGANKLVLKGDKVYVANNGGFGQDNKISIIDTSTDAVTSTITVGDNPNSLQFDKDGNLWVVSTGAFAYNEDFTIDEAHSTKASLSKIGTDNKEALRLTFSELAYFGVGQLEINTAGDKLFYNYEGAVYSISTSATTLPSTPFIDKVFYGLAVDPFNDNIIGTEALDFSSPGKIYIYNSSGALQKSIIVGIAPNGCAFK